MAIFALMSCIKRSLVFDIFHIVCDGIKCAKLDICAIREHYFSLSAFCRENEARRKIRFYGVYKISRAAKHCRFVSVPFSIV